MFFLYHDWYWNTSQHDLSYHEYQLRRLYMMNKIRLYVTTPRNVFNKNTVFHEKNFISWYCLSFIRSFILFYVSLVTVHGNRRHTLQHKHLGHGEYIVWVPNVFSNQLVKMVASNYPLWERFYRVPWSHGWLPLYIFMEHYNDVIMGAMASQITSRSIVYWTVYSGTDQRTHQSSASLVFVRVIHRWPVNSPPKSPVTRKMFHLMASSLENDAWCREAKWMTEGIMLHEWKCISEPSTLYSLYRWLSTRLQ